jgi:hypothetical protein
MRGVEPVEKVWPIDNVKMKFALSRKLRQFSGKTLLDFA